ncbi:MAG: hypothetical protein RIT27_1223 [Pseudomonadota bacterium]|jgi:hypothetical protein
MFKPLCTIVMTAVLSSCAYQPVPIEANRAPTYQLDMQAIQHWDRLADLIATNIETYVPKAETLPTQSAPLDLNAPNAGTNAPTDLTRVVIYINPPRGGKETAFSDNFKELVKSRLVQKGIPVTIRAEGATTYCSRANFCKPMILDYNVDVVHHKNRSRWIDEPKSEVVVHTALLDGDLVIFSRSDAFYINTGDDDHYTRNTKSLKVVDQ